MKENKKENENEKKDSKNQARAQFDEIVAIVNELNSENDKTREEAELKAVENALEVSFRSGWNSEPYGLDAEEFKILLSTGGPAVRIIGSLGILNEPEEVKLQHQDWFTPWQDYPLTDEEREILHAYSRQFCFVQ